MVTWRFGIILCLVAIPTIASTIDVSTSATAVLHTGDSLSFAVAGWNFVSNAAGLGLPEYPTEVGFGLASAPETAGQLSAVLQSHDGSLSMAFGPPLHFIPGWFQGFWYQGAAGTVEGTISLTPSFSQELFAGPGAILTLTNTGPDMTIGLPPYTLQQDLNVSLSGGGLDLGAPQGRVSLNEAGGATAAVPEPASSALFGSAAALLYFIRQSLHWISHRRVS
jgi:hypothetical protein